MNIAPTHALEPVNSTVRANRPDPWARDTRNRDLEKMVALNPEKKVEAVAASRPRAESKVGAGSCGWAGW